jgi:outer membrane protein TolC
MRNAKVQEAKLNLDKMKVTQQQATEGLNLQYQNTFNDFQTNFASFITNKQNMQLAKKIFDQTMIKYKEGVSSAMDLNTSQNQYLTTQRDYFSALNNLLSAKVKLDNLLSKNVQQNNLK